MANSLKALFDLGCNQLKKLPNPQLDTKILLLSAAGVSEETFFAHPETAVSRDREKRFLEFLLQRRKGIPIAYITGKKEFWSMVFQIEPGVLVPRPETEILVETVLDLPVPDGPKIFEIGTGAGHVAAALSKSIPQAVVFAEDISLTALKIAQRNDAALKAVNIHFFCGNLFDPVKPAKDTGVFDLVVSNPPYLSDNDWTEVDPGIRDFEPKAALVSGPSGLEIISKIIDQSPDYLRPGGYICLETGYNQAEAAAAMFGAQWTDIRIKKDLAGIPRVISARRLP